jgi:hypothetical protein
MTLSGWPSNTTAPRSASAQTSCDRFHGQPSAAARTASNPSVSWRTGRDAVTLLEQIAGEIRDA